MLTIELLLGISADNRRLPAASFRELMTLEVESYCDVFLSWREKIHTWTTGLGLWLDKQEGQNRSAPAGRTERQYSALVSAFIDTVVCA